MTHLTYIHYIFLAIILLLFVIFSYLAIKRTTYFISLSLVNIFVFSAMAFFSIFVVDTYTKKAIVKDLDQQRILRNETISFTGTVHNIGKFTIGKCYYEIKLVNNIDSQKLNGTEVFSPRAGLTNEKGKGRPGVASKEFVIAENLRPNEERRFSVWMPYPPYFKGTRSYQKLTCH